jgi:hypothetical protein
MVIRENRARRENRLWQQECFPGSDATNAINANNAINVTNATNAINAKRILRPLCYLRGSATGGFSVT